MVGYQKSSLALNVRMHLGPKRFTLPVSKRLFGNFAPLVLAHSVVALSSRSKTSK